MTGTWPLLVASCVLPTAAIVSVAAPRRRHIAGRLGMFGAAAAVLAAATLAALGPAHTPRGGADTAYWIGLGADPLTVVLLLLVCSVSTIVQLFGYRQLRGDSRAPAFAVRAGVLTTATATMVSAGSLLTFAVAWTAAGIALVALVGLYRPAPSARAAVRQTAYMVICGDAALWGAILLHLTTGGHNDIARLSDELPRSATVDALIGCLLVVAAAARCAHIPFHRWLSASLAAPTPVSALLHAGVVNAGGILLVRLNPLFSVSAWASGLCAAIAAISIVPAVIVMLTRPDIKGALVHSTIAQMAFMLLCCSTGLLAAAVAHLIAHGLFKASLFLGSGSAVQSHVRTRQSPPIPVLGRPRIAAMACAALLVAALTVAGCYLLLHLERKNGSAVLLVYICAAAAVAGWGWLRARPTPVGFAVLVMVIPAVTVAYSVIIALLDRYLGGAIPASGPATVPTWVLLVVVAILAAAALLPALSSADQPSPFAVTLYGWALTAGQLPAPSRPDVITAPTLPVTAASRPAPGQSQRSYLAPASIEKAASHDHS